MTYLDPDATRTTINWGKWLFRIATAAAIATLSWFALTLGTDNGSVQPQIISEPVATDPALEVQ